MPHGEDGGGASSADVAMNVREISQTCTVCLRPFSYGATGPGRKRKTCSATCSKARKKQLQPRYRARWRRQNKRNDEGGSHRRRARRAQVAYEPVNRLKVFERDGWRCQICGVLTPRRLLGKLKPRSPELDHRVPMALGGGHLWANVQCACRQCNASKGGDRVRGQLALFPKP